MTLDDEAAKVGARRAILDWRDRHEIAVLIALPRAWADGRRRIEAKLDEIGWQELIATPNAFIAREIDPLIEQEIAPVAQRLLADAGAELDAVLEAQTALLGMPAPADGGAATTDLIAALGPLAAGIGVAAVAQGAVVVAGTAFFGLVATSTVSAAFSWAVSHWPVSGWRPV